MIADRIVRGESNIPATARRIPAATNGWVGCALRKKIAAKLIEQTATISAGTTRADCLDSDFITGATFSFQNFRYAQIVTLKKNRRDGNSSIFGTVDENTHNSKCPFRVLLLIIKIVMSGNKIGIF